MSEDKLKSLLQQRPYAYKVQEGLKPLPNVRNIIAVASGKGGVGKSTVSLYLALALARAGARVGLLDADIYGPSQPHMLGALGRAQVTPEKKLLPILRHGLQTMSIGYLLDSSTPTIWRGPMLSSALKQLLFDTEWEDLDFLILDLPPGTGDIQLTLAQKVPLTGTVIVTTPQLVALQVAKKGAKMFQKVGVSVLGYIDNMSTFGCSHCGEESTLFQKGDIVFDEDQQYPCLGQLPFNSRWMRAVEKGTPDAIEAKDWEPIQSVAVEMLTALMQLPRALTLGVAIKTQTTDTGAA